MSKISLRTQIVKLDIRNMHAFAAPLLFAFRCKSQTMSLSSIAEVKGKPENVTVTFHHLEVEPFRENRYMQYLWLLLCKVFVIPIAYYEQVLRVIDPPEVGLPQRLALFLCARGALICCDGVGHCDDYRHVS